MVVDNVVIYHEFCWRLRARMLEPQRRATLNRPMVMSQFERGASRF
jgi:hypothetical protein